MSDIRAVTSHCPSHHLPSNGLPDEPSLSFDSKYYTSGTENIYSTVDDDIESYEHLGLRIRTENEYESTYFTIWPENRDAISDGYDNYGARQ